MKPSKSQTVTWLAFAVVLVPLLAATEGCKRRQKEPGEKPPVAGTSGDKPNDPSGKKDDAATTGKAPPPSAGGSESRTGDAFRPRPGTRFGYVWARTLNLRGGPSRKEAVLDRLGCKELVEITGEDKSGEWYSVRNYHERLGWAAKSWIFEIEKSEPRPPNCGSIGSKGGSHSGKEAQSDGGVKPEPKIELVGPKPPPTPPSNKDQPAPEPTPLAPRLAANKDNGPAVIELVEKNDPQQEPVRFFHHNHNSNSKRVPGCVTCHHPAPGAPAGSTAVNDNKRCRSCHTRSPKAPVPESLTNDAVFHDLCIGCHKSKNGPTDCKQCHKNG